MPQNRGRSAGSRGAPCLVTQRLAVQWGVALAALIVLVAAGILLFQNLRLRQQLRETQARRDELRQSEQKLQEEMQAQRSAAAAAEQEIARLQNERQRSEQETGERRNRAGPTRGIVSFILAPPLRGAGEVRSLSVPPAPTASECCYNSRPQIIQPIAWNW